MKPLSHRSAKPSHYNKKAESYDGEGKTLELSFKGRTDGFTCGFVSYPYLLTSFSTA